MVDVRPVYDHEPDTQSVRGEKLASDTTHQLLLRCVAYTAIVMSPFVVFSAVFA